MNYKKVIPCVAAFFLVVASYAQNKVQEAVNALNANEFASCSFGVQVMCDDGTVVAELNADRKLNPASNMKAITTAAALQSLGADYKWETSLAYTGAINRAGTLLGDLYIIGGGDPMLGSRHADAKPLQQYYEQMYGLLEKAGIKHIKGDIIGDGSWICGMREDPSWSYDDLGTYYGTCCSGLNFFENRQGFKASTVGMSKGEALTLQPTFPHTPWMTWNYECMVGDRGTGDRMYLYMSENGTSGIIRGSFGAETEKEVFFRNNYPERSLALDFKTWLQEAKAVTTSGEALGVISPKDSLSVEHMAGGLNDLGSVYSPDLNTVITRTNQDSNNLYAEVLLRTMGQELGEGSNIESARAAMGRIIAQDCGVPFTAKELVIQDGSGLSTKNRVSPSFMCRFLRKVLRSENAEVFRNSLVKYSSRCYYKTGSFTGCRCLCGYMLPSQPGGKTVIFSIMVNNSEMKTGEIDRIEKSLLGVIAGLSF